MLLLTANRNAKGEDSLEQTICEEGTSTSLPVVTIGNLNRLVEREYREQCNACLAEIVLFIENYLLRTTWESAACLFHEMSEKASDCHDRILKAVSISI